MNNKIQVGRLGVNQLFMHGGFLYTVTIPWNPVYYTDPMVQRIGCLKDDGSTYICTPSPEQTLPKAEMVEILTPHI